MCWFLSVQSIVCAQKFSCKGVVHDYTTHAVLSNTYIYISEQQIGVLTDSKGRFSIDVSQGTYTFILSHIGYHDAFYELTIVSDTTVVFTMQHQGVLIDDVIIRSQFEESPVHARGSDNISLTRQNIERNPRILGEPDIVRTLAFSGGVRQMEGSQGMNVRGGSQEQNLILLDGATVFNPSHLLGFFSVFPFDAISSAQLYTSAAPIQYGGRMSSVLHIDSRNGLVDSLEGTISAGLLSSRLMFAAPISKKSGLRVSYRASYLDMIVMPIVSNFIQNGAGNETSFDFYDALIRFDNVYNDKNILSLTWYGGKDIYTMYNPRSFLTNDVSWGNTVLSLQWKHFSSPNIQHTSGFSYSEYNFVFTAAQDFYTLDVKTGIRKNSVSYSRIARYSDYEYTIGADVSLTDFNSGSISAQIDGVDIPSFKPLLSRSAEMNMFASYQKNISSKLAAEFGIRIMPYAHIGPAIHFIYDAELAIVDSTVYKPFEILYSNIGFEPRAQFRYLLTRESSLKASIVRSNQNLHMVSMLSAALPADIWLPATAKAPSQKGMQYSIGYYRDFKESAYTGSVVVYAKTMRDLIEFKDGFITLYYSETFEDKITSGKGFASGVEFSFAKTKGAFQSAVSYSFSRTLRTFEDINMGVLYPAAYDKPHDLSVMASYELFANLRLSAIWVVSSGKVYSEPISRYFIGKNLINEYGPINNSRMPLYHRMDVSLDYLAIQNQKHELRIDVSVYNVYNRINSYYVYHDIIGDVDSFSMSMNRNFVGLFPILPSCSIIFTF